MPGNSLIVTCADPWVIAYSVQDGKEIWRTKSLRQDVGPSPVASGELVYAANEFPGISAIRLGGQGDVTDTHVAWFADIGVPDTCSPLVVKDLLLLQASFGTLSCYDAQKGGEPLWEEEFDENFRSSPGFGRRACVSVFRVRQSPGSSERRGTNASGSAKTTWVRSASRTPPLPTIGFTFGAKSTSFG